MKVNFYKLLRGNTLNIYLIVLPLNIKLFLYEYHVNILHIIKIC